MVLIALATEGAESSKEREEVGRAIRQLVPYLRYCKSAFQLLRRCSSKQQADSPSSEERKEHLLLATAPLPYDIHHQEVQGTYLPSARPCPRRSQIQALVGAWKCCCPSPND